MSLDPWLELPSVGGSQAGQKVELPEPEEGVVMMGPPEEEQLAEEVERWAAAEYKDLFDKGAAEDKGLFDKGAVEKESRKEDLDGVGEQKNLAVAGCRSGWCHIRHKTFDWIATGNHIPGKALQPAWVVHRNHRTFGPLD